MSPAPGSVAVSVLTALAIHRSAWDAILSTPVQTEFGFAGVSRPGRGTDLRWLRLGLDRRHECLCVEAQKAAP